MEAMIWAIAFIGLGIWIIWTTRKVSDLERDVQELWKVQSRRDLEKINPGL